MAQRRDDAPVDRPVSHSNPVTQAGFTMIPNTVMLRGDLSVGAKLLYGYLKHIAWRADGAEVDPPREVVERDLCLSENTVIKLFRELQAAPVAEGGGGEMTRLIEARRRGQGLTNLYVVNDPEVRTSDSEVLEVEDSRFPARAVPSLGSKTRSKRELEPQNGSSSAAAPPRLTKLEGRDVAFDALADVTGSNDPNAGRQVAVGLNGNKGLTGIRQLAWDELTPTAQEAYRADPAAWERYLAAAIVSRAGTYISSMPIGTLLTPTALAKWWGRVEGIRGTGVASEADFEALVNRGLAR